MSGSDSNIGKVLLIGEAAEALLEEGEQEEFPLKKCDDIAEGIRLASRGDFSVIAVLMSSVKDDIGGFLRALRGSNKGARIVLLARMYEEPIAIQLCGTTADGANLADNYLICPVGTQRFQRELNFPVKQAGTEVQAEQRSERVERRLRELERLATEDELTGLKNRRYIWEFGRQIIERAGGKENRVTLLIFDIDDLKSYNDTYGHLAGDRILKQAGVLMNRCCRSHDVVGRIGGDEFAVIFWDGPEGNSGDKKSERRSTEVEHPREAVTIAKRFQKQLENAELNLLGPGGRGVLTISGALASFPQDGENIEQLFEKADKALLEAKHNGKNKIYLVGKPESDIADIH